MSVSAAAAKRAVEGSSKSGRDSRLCGKLAGQRLVTYQTDANGQPVNQILVEAATDIGKELVPGAVVDRSSRRVVLWRLPKVAEIESCGRKPHLIHKVALDPADRPDAISGTGTGVQIRVWKVNPVQQFTKILWARATIFLERDPR